MTIQVTATDANRFDFWYAADIVDAIDSVTAAAQGLDAATVDKVLTLFAEAFGLTVTDGAR